MIRHSDFIMFVCFVLSPVLQHLIPAICAIEGRTNALILATVERSRETFEMRALTHDSFIHFLPDHLGRIATYGKTYDDNMNNNRYYCTVFTTSALTLSFTYFLFLFISFVLVSFPSPSGVFVSSWRVISVVSHTN